MKAKIRLDQGKAAVALKLFVLGCSLQACGAGEEAKSPQSSENIESAGLRGAPSILSATIPETAVRRTPLFRLGIRSADGQFLGCWNCLEDDPDSVLNQLGVYGSAYSNTSLRNPFGQGSPYAPNGACNPYATEGATLFLLSGILPPGRPVGFGSLSVNTYAPGGVCNPVARFYNPSDCSKLRFLCTGEGR